MSELDRALERARAEAISMCIDQVEQFAKEYVQRWHEIEGSQLAQAYGWAILMAAQDLRRLYPKARIVSESE